MRIILTLFISIFLFNFAYSQDDIHPVRISGVIIDAETGSAVPYVNVRLDGTIYGTSSDINGHFTILMNNVDTLNFTSIGYKDAYFTPLANLNKNEYTLVQMMVKETIELEEITVFPWPEWEDFEKAFLEAPPAEPIDQRTLLLNRDLKEVSKLEYETNKYMYDQMRYQRLYDLNGIIPPNNFLNPINWTNFIYELQNNRPKN